MPQMLHLERRSWLFSPWFWNYWCSEFGDSGTYTRNTGGSHRPKNRNTSPPGRPEMTSDIWASTSNEKSCQSNAASSSLTQCTYHHPPQHLCHKYCSGNQCQSEEMVVYLLVFVGKAACCPVLTPGLNAGAGLGLISASPSRGNQTRKNIWWASEWGLSGWIKKHSEVLKHEV